MSSTNTPDYPRVFSENEVDIQEGQATFVFEVVTVKIKPLKKKGKTKKITTHNWENLSFKNIPTTIFVKNKYYDLESESKIDNLITCYYKEKNDPTR